MNRILLGDSIDTLTTLPDRSVDCCVTSPPYYGLRDYGTDGQIGTEGTPEAYIQRLVEVFREVHRILRNDGTLWVNIGDSYAGSGRGAWANKTAQKETYAPDTAKKKTWNGIKAKDLIGIPWMLAFALRADGWYLRQDIIWHKPNAMPESVTDRCTKAHEYIFMLSKSRKYYYDGEAIKELAASTGIKKFTDNGRDKQRGHARRHAGFNGRYAEKLVAEGAPTKKNRRDVWTVATRPYAEAHFATYPEKLILPCVLAGSREGGIILDPFIGSGTTAVVAIRNQRRFVGCEINREYAEMAERRIASEAGLFYAPQNANEGGAG